MGNPIPVNHRNYCNICSVGKLKIWIYGEAPHFEANRRLVREGSHFTVVP
jgi:hypothetical protein